MSIDEWMLVLVVACSISSDRLRIQAPSGQVFGVGPLGASEPCCSSIRTAERCPVRPLRRSTSQRNADSRRGGSPGRTSAACGLSPRRPHAPYSLLPAPMPVRFHGRCASLTPAEEEKQEAITGRKGRKRRRRSTRKTPLCSPCSSHPSRHWKGKEREKSSVV
jgi:hypothetical protein